MAWFCISACCFGWSRALGLCRVGQLGEMFLALLILSFSFKVSCTNPFGKEEDGGFAQILSATILYFGNLGISLKAFVSCKLSATFFAFSLFPKSLSPNQTWLLSSINIVENYPLTHPDPLEHQDCDNLQKDVEVWLLLASGRWILSEKVVLICITQPH